MFNELFIMMALKRFNDQKIKCVNDKDTMKALVEEIRKAMDLIGIDSIDYIVKFDLVSSFIDDEPKYLVTLEMR